MQSDTTKIENAVREAFSSTNPKRLSFLSHSCLCCIREAVAQNKNTPRDTLNKLAFDPTANVTHKALANPSCTTTRDNFTFDPKIDQAHPCIKCTKPAIAQNCTKCSENKK